ncbi:MAG: FAD-dependent oxidoreductase [Clostridia bacterium]|nr:FAD-dependent oxidoreductase [Clostridia bacterium]
MKENKNLYDVAVIGGGPAGLTAAIYLARARYRVVVIEKEKFGGQITITSEVVNYPGIESISGEELTKRMQKQADSFGAEFIKANVSAIDVSGDVKKVVTDRGDIECFGILIATGAHPRMIGFDGEAEFRGHGVAYCATCDGEFFTDKEVFVIGGGFAAAEESVFLTKYAKHVTVIMRGEDFSCAPSAAEEAKNNEKISIIYNSVVKSVSGDSSLKEIVYTNKKTGEDTVYTAESGDTFGVFVFAGYEPETELFKNAVELDQSGYIVTDKNQKTNVDGVYAAGDVCIKNLRQVVTAVGDGALAATELEKYAAEMQKKTDMRPVLNKKEAVKKSAEKPKENKENNNGLLTPDIIAQLNAVFARMTSNLVLELHLDDRNVSSELRSYMNAIAEVSDKITVKTADTDLDNKEELPFVRICKQDGTYTGLAFHGVPGGHEFTSFVLGLYNAAGPGQPLTDDLAEKIKTIDKPVDIQIMVSLSCTMCPELVTAAQKIAASNVNVRAEVFDINHFGNMKDKYNVMSVPCMVINNSAPMFGKKDIKQILDIIHEI